MCQALGFVIFMQGSPAPGLLCLHWACVLVPLLPHQTGQGLMYLSVFHSSVLDMEQLLKNLCVGGTGTSAGAQVPTSAITSITHPSFDLP